jgi:hypothetical protein
MEAPAFERQQLTLASQRHTTTGGVEWFQLLGHKDDMPKDEVVLALRAYQLSNIYS